MPKCPSCGAVLEVSLTTGTDYTKTKEILANAAELTNERLDSLKWKQSQKRDALSTILVTEAALGVPLIRLLYDRLQASANKSWKLSEVTYKVSQNGEGTQWIQRWTPIK